jgi:hypothetical protein
VSATTAPRRAVRGKYRCRSARGRAKTTSWNVGGFGGYSDGRGRLAHPPCRYHAAHGCALGARTGSSPWGLRTTPINRATRLAKTNRNRQGQRNNVPFPHRRTLLHRIGEMRKLYLHRLSGPAAGVPALRGRSCARRSRNDFGGVLPCGQHPASGPAPPWSLGYRLRLSSPSLPPAPLPRTPAGRFTSTVGRTRPPRPHRPRRRMDARQWPSRGRIPVRNDERPGRTAPLLRDLWSVQVARAAGGVRSGGAGMMLAEALISTGQPPTGGR